MTIGELMNPGHPAAAIRSAGSFPGFVFWVLPAAQSLTEGGDFLPQKHPGSADGEEQGEKQLEQRPAGIWVDIRQTGVEMAWKEKRHGYAEGLGWDVQLLG
jgi:hypothetical protein